MLIFNTSHTKKAIQCRLRAAFVRRNESKKKKRKDERSERKKHTPKFAAALVVISFRFRCFTIIFSWRGILLIGWNLLSVLTQVDRILFIRFVYKFRILYSCSLLFFLCWFGFCYSRKLPCIYFILRTLITSFDIFALEIFIWLLACVYFSIISFIFLVFNNEQPSFLAISNPFALMDECHHFYFGHLINKDLVFSIIRNTRTTTLLSQLYILSSTCSQSETIHSLKISSFLSDFFIHFHFLFHSTCLCTIKIHSHTIPPKCNICSLLFASWNSKNSLTKLNKIYNFFLLVDRRRRSRNLVCRVIVARGVHQPF